MKELKQELLKVAYMITAGQYSSTK